MSEQEVDSKSHSITVTPPSPIQSEANLEEEGQISEVTPINETPTVVVTENVKEEEKEEIPSPPQIVIVTEEGQEKQEITEEDLVKNNELIMEEPQTPIPIDNTAEESETTIPDDESSYSTVTPESLNDDTKPIIVDESDFQGPVIDFYKNKNILMTGATGFVGKAILWKLIQALRQEIGSIYILVRSGSIKRSKIGKPEERLRNEIFNNKVC